MPLIEGTPTYIRSDNEPEFIAQNVRSGLDYGSRCQNYVYLPSYSPELNPEERLNADPKHVIGHKVPMRTKTKLRDATEDHMGGVASGPKLVKVYFQDLRVKYAA